MNFPEHLRTHCVRKLFWMSKQNKLQFLYTTCSQHVLSLKFSYNSMNNLLSYFGLVDTRRSGSEKVGSWNMSPYKSVSRKKQLFVSSALPQFEIFQISSFVAKIFLDLQNTINADTTTMDFFTINLNNVFRSVIWIEVNLIIIITLPPKTDMY